MHSFGMSEHYVVLAEYPLVADVQAIAARKRPFIENYEWLPERGTIFTVVSKADGTVVARAQGEPFLGIHQINCFERDGAIVFDVPAYPEGRHICNLYLDRRAAAEALETSQIKRYTVPLNGRDVTGGFCSTSSPSCRRSTISATPGWTTQRPMPQAVARIGRKGFIISSCASTCEAIGCDAGSRIGVILENRYSFRGRMLRIVLKA